jgi:putative transposase
LPVTKQCELIELNRPSFYYREKPRYLSVDQYLLDEVLAIHLKYPFMGSRRIRHELSKKDYFISKKKVASLMKLLKIRAIYPGMNLSLPKKEHKKYPYLLRDLEITRPNQVWSTDITYIKTRYGFMYLTAVIDVYSRYIVSWELSNSLSKELCTTVLKKALEQAKPEIVNTDQGSQYTSSDFVELITEENDIKLSMDSKGRALDNIWIERFWRTVKYEEIHLKDYKSNDELYSCIKKFIDFYNNERGHQTFDYATPESLYKKLNIDNIA